jgi:hypothetical protein
VSCSILVVAGTHKTSLLHQKAPLLVLILVLPQTQGWACSFLRKKPKQTAHAHRWERCIQKNRERERERNVCACILPSIWHMIGVNFIWANVRLRSLHWKP